MCVCVCGCLFHFSPLFIRYMEVIFRTLFRLCNTYPLRQQIISWLCANKDELMYLFLACMYIHKLSNQQIYCVVSFQSFNVIQQLINCFSTGILKHDIKTIYCIIKAVSQSCLVVLHFPTFVVNDLDQVTSSTTQHATIDFLAPFFPQRCIRDV